jgi:hypothetical protein
VVVRAQITFRNPSKLLPIKKCFYAWDWLGVWENEEREGTEGGNGGKKIISQFSIIESWLIPIIFNINYTNELQYLYYIEWMSKQEKLPRFYIIYIEIKWKRNYTL